MTLRTKTSILLALIIAVAFLLTGYFYLRFLQESLKRSILSGVEAVATTTAENIAKFLEESLQDAQAAALALPLEALEKNDLAPVEARLAQLVKIYKKFENGMFILDHQGRVWVDYPPYPGVRGVDVSFREYFQRTMREGRGVVGAPYVSLRTNQPVITFTALLKGSRQQVLGVLGCSVQMLSENALEGVRKLRIGQTGYVYVYDRSRKMLLHPESERVFKVDVPPGVNRLFDAALNGFEGVGETVNSRGVPMLLALKRIRGTDWILGAQQPQREAYAPLVKARWNLFFGGLLAILATMGVGAVAVRRVTKPLASLRRGVMLLGGEEGKETEEIEKEWQGIRSGDEIEELAAAFQNMSRRLKETMNSLKRANLDWERTFDSVPDLIAIVDENNRIVKLNRAMADKLGVTPGTAVGMAGEELFWGETLAESEKEQISLKERLEFKLGPDYLVSHAPLQTLEGEVLGAVYVARDISERRLAEEQRRKMQEELAQAQKMEALGTLAGGIAHDFNNILSAMIGYAELCRVYQKEGENTEALACLEEVLRAGIRARDLVNQILTFSRQARREPQPVAVRGIIEESLRFLRAFIPSNIEIRASLAEEVGMVLADPVQVQQVVMNLCTNAYQAMEKTGGVLELMVDRVEIIPGDLGKDAEAAPGGYYIRITVKDNGPGMDPETVKRIFEPFFTTKVVGGGTGLGLSVVHGIVKDLGGGIRVDSRPGVGSTFEVYLPQWEGRELTAQEPEPEIVGGREHILVVDDEPQLVEISRKMLARLGYRVTTATEPRDALKIFEADPWAFDLVITDLTMPHLTGLELARVVFEVRPDMPIILTTGYDEATAVEQARELGIRNYLLKPVVFRQLALAVRKVLDGEDEKPGTGKEKVLKGGKADVREIGGLNGGAKDVN